MLKWFSTSFALLLLLQSSNISISDVLKIDNLISHARFHGEYHGDSLFVFISKHYGELKESHNQEHKHEQTEHEHLPFNHSSCAHHVVVIAYFTPASKEELKTIQLDELKESNFHYSAPFSIAHTTGLLQPPRES
ncbi:MAG: hypothetical protein NWQ09_01420 [Nonlabens sp.]|nr:hypothetical protein [Nonlabens sp.]